MKVVIFAGGFGTRISEESHLKPKPMIEIAEKPLLWHLMKIYATQGFNEFIICLGYKGFMIKEYFMNYYAYNSDVTVDLKHNNFEVHRSCTENFRVTLVETGLHTGTAGRLKRIKHYLGDDDFFLTYGDGLANVDLHELLRFHQSHNKIATVTAVRPAGRFGLLSIESNNEVHCFKEKPLGDGGWINGGFFVFRAGVFSYLPEDADRFMLEESTMENLVHDRQMEAYHHHDFWKCMDAMRDKHELEHLWHTGQAAWKTWE